MSGFVSRGFGGRRRVPPELADRLPPGQYAEPGFPVLTAGPTPALATEKWSFRVDGMVAAELEWSWDEFSKLPFEDIPCDIHCVTKWSKFDTSFRGVSVDALLEAAEPAGEFVMAFSHDGYTTNLPLADVTGGKAWVVTGHEDGPLPAEHGGPARLLVPHLYFWKSAKWVAGLRIMDRNEPGFWEQRLPRPRRPLEGATLLGGLTQAAPRAPGRWQVATVAEIRPETPKVKTFRLGLPMWMPHLPGQHYDVRLTAPDGYQAQRSYSVASSPLDSGVVELTVDRLDDGEVSTYFHDVLVEGDQVEVRGPFASYFVWRGEAPLTLVGGGSGVVPLMCMLRHRRLSAPEIPVRLLYSVRSEDDVIYADELGDEATLTYTRSAPAGWEGHTGRVDIAMAAEADPGGMAFVCGSNGFVESAVGVLLDRGFPAGRVRTERFGPTG